MHKLFWELIILQDRIPAIQELSDILNRHGFIVQFQRFSDISLSILAEVPAYQLSELKDELENYAAPESLNLPIQEFSGDCLLFLHVHFTRGTGNLRIEVPQVPG